MRRPCTKKGAPAKQRGIWRKIVTNKLKNSDRTTFYTLIEAKVMLAPTSKKPEEREFVVDSGKRSRTPTVVLTADGDVHTREDAHVFVHDLNLFVTVQLLDETPAVLSLGKLCEDHGYSSEWVSGQKKPRLTKAGKSIICKTDNFVPLVVPGLSSNSESVSSST